MNTIETKHPVLSYLEKHLGGVSFRHQVGHQIFCKGCNNILDVSRAVGIDMYKGEKLEHSTVYCTTCWETARCRASAVARRKGITLKITDGRARERETDELIDWRHSFLIGKRGWFNTKLRKESGRGFQAKGVWGRRLIFTRNVPKQAIESPWFVHFYKKKFHVVHVQLGMAAGNGKTLAGAIAKAFGSLNSASDKDLESLAK